MPGGAALTGPTGDGAVFARWRCAYRAYGGWCGVCPVALRLPGLRGRDGAVFARWRCAYRAYGGWCGVCPVALTLTGP
ncbi:hypothetical protein DMY04_01790, partial [Enterobacter hormaechei subsp. steigerwaltii]|uniref:hypothetical protein n=1 Tax=Enterobacter hormaechei TaxID=158836 RepID=UPI000D9199C2